jgi:hypothetical protein
MAVHAQEERIETPSLPSAITTRRQILFSALATAACLFGGLLVGFAIAIAVSNLPMHMPSQALNFISMMLLLCTLFIAGAAWGFAIAKIFSTQNKKRMIWAGALTFSPALLLAGLTLGTLERAIVEGGQGPDLPVHIVFTLLFVPAAFFVAGAGGLALGLAERNLRLGLRLAAGGGIAAALGFLLVDLLMDALGWRVGAPGAAERATMLTVMMTGNLAAALAGGGILGYQLSRYFQRNTVDLVQ